MYYKSSVIKKIILVIYIIHGWKSILANFNILFVHPKQYEVLLDIFEFFEISLLCFAVCIAQIYFTIHT